ncbi:MAG: Ig-like domain-containing protein [Lachnospiraceae bacterium]|nr:Ig-like domain-containing protein [Lachnospiraceae bacterium]
MKKKFRNILAMLATVLLCFSELGSIAVQAADEPLIEAEEETEAVDEAEEALAEEGEDLSDPEEAEPVEEKEETVLPDGALSDYEVGEDETLVHTEVIQWAAPVVNEALPKRARMRACGYLDEELHSHKGVRIVDSFWKDEGSSCVNDGQYDFYFKLETLEGYRFADDFTPSMSYEGIFDTKNPNGTEAVKAATDREGYWVYTYTAPSRDEMVRLPSLTIEVPDGKEYLGSGKPAMVSFSGSEAENYCTFVEEYILVSDWSSLSEEGYPLNAGKYKLVVKGTGIYSGKVEKSFEIKPSKVTVEPYPAYKTYGKADPELEFTNDAFYAIRDEFLASLEGSLSREPGEYVGFYPISQGSLKLRDDVHNFTLRWENDWDAQLSIEPVQQKLEVIRSLRAKPGDLITADDFESCVRFSSPSVNGVSGGDLSFRVVSGNELYTKVDNATMKIQNGNGVITLEVTAKAVDVNGDGTAEFKATPYNTYKINIYVNEKDDTAITTAYQEVELNCGAAPIQLAAKAEPAGTNGKFSYSVADEKIATVDADGTLTAGNGGSTVVTVEYESDEYWALLLIPVKITKNAGPAAPEGLSTRAPQNLYGQGRILGTTSAMEYASLQYEDYEPCGDGETAVIPGKYKVRYAETDHELAGEFVQVEVGSYQHDKSATLHVERVDEKPLVYDGTPKEPGIYVYYSGSDYDEYEVKYSNNTAAFELPEGKSFADYSDDELKTMKAPVAEVKVKGNVTGERRIYFEIERKSIAKYDDRGNTPWIEAVEPADPKDPALYYGDYRLGKDDIEFSVSGESIIVNGKGNFKGSRTLEASTVTGTKKLNAKLLVKKYKFTGREQELTFDDGENKKPSIRVYDAADKKKTALQEGDDYAVIYPADMISAGTKNITIVGLDEYSGSTVTVPIKVSPAKLKKSQLDIEMPTAVDYYPGTVQIDEAISIFAKINGNLIPLKQDVDYTLKYANNKKAGKARVSIRFIGNLKGTGTVSRKFTIAKAELFSCDIALTDVKYEGKAGTYYSAPYIFYEGEAVPKKQYKIEYFNYDTGNKITKSKKIKLEEGERRIRVDVKITGKGNFKGVWESFYWVYDPGEIENDPYIYDMSGATVKITDMEGNELDKLVYTGDRQTLGRDFDLRVSCKGRDGNVFQLDDKDYSVEVLNNTYSGTMTLVLSGIDGWGKTVTQETPGWVGSVVVEIPIVPVQG